MLRSLYHALLPSGVRERISAKRRESAFTHAFDRLRRDPFGAVQDDALLSKLLYGWANEGWSANGQYLRRIVQCMQERPVTSVLECGSGLSTLVIGAAAERTGARLTSLEHHPAWREKVRQQLARFDISCVTVVLAPIEDYGAFEWYRTDPTVLGQRYDLVVCDGPPGETRGGRYGLLPVMRRSLASDCVVLLDDANRDAERGILNRWTEEFGGSARVGDAEGAAKQFGEYRLSDAAVRSAGSVGAAT